MKVVWLAIVMLAAQVVGAQETTIPALQPGGTRPIQVDGKADGVKAWRYKVK